VGGDYYRKSAGDLYSVKEYTANEVQPTEDGSKLLVRFENGTVNPNMDEYNAKWLHSFAPFVGKPLHAGGKARTEGIKGTGSLFDDLHKNRTPWYADAKIPEFDAEALASDPALQAEFLERMVDPGVALVHNLGAPESFEKMEVGKPMEDLITRVVGRMNQHPVRATRYGVIHTHSNGSKSADYDHKNPLSMHTDHTVYNGTPGYLQFMYQAQGHVETKVCDGIALQNYMRENHPEEYKLLTEWHITHSSRNCLYSPDGSYKVDTVLDSGSFELVHTHPVIEVDANGDLVKVAQSETKRGVSALPFDVYDKYMEAYRLWSGLAEKEQFIRKFHWPEHAMVCMNNYRVLHGRASVPPNMHRTMIFGYCMKTIVENRYRLLRQSLIERDSASDLNAQWLTRVPNQVLSSMVL
jgi:alpha-ketoglutarate-dependent taurine dioxygenase